ncbi:MAG: glycosyltransferase family 2 protein [Deltaproteobacteria bacterium]|jgi:glycosyltransferase involved in cell wall biosynthesis|nr:glycosyltransferase family 2 protein [Deltaproteobacteria bacterium]
MPPMVSVVIPAYRSEAVLPVLLGRLEMALSGLGYPFEVVIVDDASPDDTWYVLKKLASTRPFLRIVRLMKNCGQHRAILCGMSLTRGDRIVTMDDDLQNPPEEIPRLLSALDEGYDLAIASYGEKMHSASRNLFGSFVDFTQKRIFSLPASFKLTSFRAFTRPVAEGALAMPSGRPYITSMLLSSTDRLKNVETEHSPRTFGKSNYTLKRGLSLCLDLWLTYSSYPLYLVMTLCILSLLFAASFAGIAAWQAITTDTTSGWASQIVTISFFSALILMSLTVHGVYLSRMAGARPRPPVGETLEGGWAPRDDLGLQEGVGADVLSKNQAKSTSVHGEQYASSEVQDNEGNEPPS